VLGRTENRAFDGKRAVPFGDRPFPTATFLLRQFVENLIEQNPAKRVKDPQAPKTVVATFSETEVRQLPTVVDRKQHAGFRNYVDSALRG
jgi:hypothetical protein